MLLGQTLRSANLQASSIRQSNLRESKGLGYPSPLCIRTGRSLVNPLLKCLILAIFSLMILNPPLFTSSGVSVMKPAGVVCLHRDGADDAKTIASLKLEAGDVFDVCILVSSVNGRAAHLPGRLNTRSTRE